MGEIKWLLFDWGDTLMFDNPKYKGEMYMWPEITLMPGVLEALPMLAKKYQCAVVSNATDSNAVTVKNAFERMGIDNYFKLFITSKEIGYKKPDDRFFTYIANLLNMPPEMMCMVGNDYEKDIVTPKKLGMNTILITTVGGKYPLSDKTVDSFSQLMDILK